MASTYRWYPITGRINGITANIFIFKTNATTNLFDSNLTGIKSSTLIVFIQTLTTNSYLVLFHLLFFQLNKYNITAVRFNLKRGGSESINHLEYLSNKLKNEFGWHTEFYLDSKDLEELNFQLNKIKTFSIFNFVLSFVRRERKINWC